MTKHNSLGAILLFIYSLLCYAATLIALLYFIVFCSGLYEPISVNSQGGEYGSFTALLINILLLLVFGIQHSVMARHSFKAWLSKFMPSSVERSTYCLASAFALAIIPFGWQPIDGLIWEVSSPWLRYVLHGGSVLGWGVLVLATFQIGHFELFGLKQSYDSMIGKRRLEASFKTPGLYRFVRHPIQLGVLMGMWLVPTSTTSHLMLSIGMTLYILVGLYFEEKDLISEFGLRYSEYRQRVAKLIPFIA
jgi:protein-S-isoprenylcysteine O-methyltransferase Ste14